MSRDGIVREVAVLDDLTFGQGSHGGEPF
jgi:hypothetical protein